MTKELFKKSILAIKTQMEHDEKCSNAFRIILPDSFIGTYNNYYLYETIILILKESLNLKSRWIEYYIYDLRFGAKYKKGCVTDKGKNVKLKTIDDLWSLLND